jgi:hypothetical protein
METKYFEWNFSFSTLLMLYEETKAMPEIVKTFLGKTNKIVGDFK